MRGRAGGGSRDEQWAATASGVSEGPSWAACMYAFKEWKIEAGQFGSS